MNAVAPAPLQRLAAAWEGAATALDAGDEETATRQMLLAQAILDGLTPGDDDPAWHAQVANAQTRLGAAVQRAHAQAGLDLIDLARSSRAAAAYRSDGDAGGDARFVDRRQ
jgi:hypothetical protein